MKYRGVAYYPEYWPEERWNEDIRLMRAAHINLVRVGEFAWSAMEPAEEQYTLDWLHRLVQQMGAADINVLLCTPTATPPAWLTQQYPEVTLMLENGQRRMHGHRRHYCFTSPTYRAHSRRITDVLSREFAGYGNVIGWQLDNELGCERGWCFCEHCQAKFRLWLQQRYGSLAELNARWGTRFWSMEYTAWDQVRLGMTDVYPSTALDTQRFFSDNLVDFANEQAGIIRANHPDTLVVTNGMGPLFEHVNYYDLFRSLDRACDDLYFDCATMDGDALAMDTYRQYKPDTPFWITETASCSLGIDKAATAGQLRAWAFSALAHGCEAYCFFRWRTCLSGHEQLMQGIIEYSGKPRRRYEAVKKLYGDLAALEETVAGLPLPTAEVAIVLDYNSFQGYYASAANMRVQNKLRIHQVYKCFYDRNIAVDIVPPDRDLSRYKLIVLPAQMMVDETFAAALRTVVAAGATVISLPQLATRDLQDNFLPACAPVGLTDLFGLRVEGGMYLRGSSGPDQALWIPEERYTEDTPTVRVNLADGERADTVTTWMEDIELEGGTAMGVYTDNTFAGCPFLVEHHTGQGRTLYLGAYPQDALLNAILADALAQAGVASGPETPEWVEVVRRGAYTFIMNHRDEPVALAMPAAQAIVGAYRDGQAQLNAHDVCVLVDATVTARV